MQRTRTDNKHIPQRLPCRALVHIKDHKYQRYDTKIRTVHKVLIIKEHPKIFVQDAGRVRGVVEGREGFT
jgi:hypothetical protein